MNAKKIDAQDIIEKFGGIRPMAKTLNVAVTTVQGWKKRNSIPQNRMATIESAAAEHNISLVSAAPLKVSKSGQLEQNDNLQSHSSDTNPQKRISTFSSENPYKNNEETHQDNAPSHVETSSISGRTMMIFLLVLLAFMIAGIMTVAPKVKVVSEQADRIVDLERELKTIQKEQSILSDIIPDDLKNKLRAIEQKTHTASDLASIASGKIEDVANSTKNVVTALNSGSVEKRLDQIEDQIGTYIEEKTSLNLAGVWQYMQALRESKEGKSQLHETSADLLSWINRLHSDEVTVEEALPIIVEESPLIAKTLGDVEPNNLKAAAMLLAMSQLRDTLSRDNQSFEQDLALLKKLVGDADPALNASIEALSPHAQKGVLTPDGLSVEFRKLAGDVVVASLSGEDVSVSEKAKSRFGSILVVEKDGEQITGTETQIAVANAQKLIDNGDIQGTIQVLQNIDGDAAKAVAPFLKEAKLSLLASQIQELLGQNIQSKIRISTLSASHDTQSFHLDKIGVENVIDDIKEAVPLGGRVYEDSESGFKIYKKGVLQP